MPIAKIVHLVPESFLLQRQLRLGKHLSAHRKHLRLTWNPGPSLSKRWRRVFSVARNRASIWGRRTSPNDLYGAPKNGLWAYPSSSLQTHASNHESRPSDDRHVLLWTEDPLHQDVLGKVVMGSFSREGRRKESRGALCDDI